MKGQHQRQLVCNWCPCRLAAVQPVQTVHITIRPKGLHETQKVLQLCDMPMDSIILDGMNPMISFRNCTCQQ